MPNHKRTKHANVGELKTDGKPVKVSSNGKRKRAPIKYNSEFCDRLIKHMAQGLTFQSFAGLIGVSIETIDAWSNPTRDDMFHPEFLAAKEIAFGKAFLWWDKKGVKGLTQKSFKEGHWSTNMQLRFRKYWNKDADPNDMDNKQLYGNIGDMFAKLLSGPAQPPVE